jgi:hypothetical protein
MNKIINIDRIVKVFLSTFATVVIIAFISYFILFCNFVIVVITDLIK